MHAHAVCGICQAYVPHLHVYPRYNCTCTCKGIFKYPGESILCLCSDFQLTEYQWMVFQWTYMHWPDTGWILMSHDHTTSNARIFIILVRTAALYCTHWSLEPSIPTGHGFASVASWCYIRGSIDSWLFIKLSQPW